MPSVEEIFAARDGATTPAPEPVANEEQKPDLQFDYSEDEGAEQKLAERESNLKFPAPGQREDSEGENKQVPIAALHEARRKYTDEVADVRKQNTELLKQLASLTEAVTRNQQHPQSQEKPKPPEFDWDNPLLTVDQRIEMRIAAERERFEQALAQERQARVAEREKIETIGAIQRHGEQLVSEAYRAFAEARATDPSWQSTYQAIQAAPDQYEALIQWHKRNKALAAVGFDLEAYNERVRAQHLEELRSGNVTPMRRSEAPLPEERRVAMPTDLSGARSVGSRSGPVWDGPPSLKDILTNR